MWRAGNVVMSSHVEVAFLFRDCAMPTFRYGSWYLVHLRLPSYAGTRFLSRLPFDSLASPRAGPRASSEIGRIAPETARREVIYSME